MKFNKDNKVDIHTLTRVEAKAFYKFLNDERQRHVEACEEANALRAFWLSAVERHLQDIEGIDKLKNKLVEMYGV